MMRRAYTHWIDAKDRWDRFSVATLDEHLRAAAEWLLAAQAATPDDGIAHSYDVRTGEWNASYPETTGYAIETLYRYARWTGRSEFSEAARRAADWEIAVQLEDGGVMAGTVDSLPAVPTIFNTGQVLFGWVAAIEHESNHDRYVNALRRAADWLVAAMDPDGAWRRYSSPFAQGSQSSYNTRTAFGLARAADALHAPQYLETALRNVRHVHALAAENGFLPHNCLQNAAAPLVHTIAYSIRGILEVGAAADDAELIDLALRMARAVARAQRPDGGIPGRLDTNWNGTVRWVCVTGNCQMALNWWRFLQAGITDEFRDHAVAANRFVMRLQNRRSRDVGVRGGIKGSDPIGAEYMRYRYPNWAAKFFMDALMLEHECQ